MLLRLNHFLKRHQHLLLALLITLLVTLPTLLFYYFGQPIMFQSHDHILHPIRLYHLNLALRQGIIAPTWLTSLTAGLGSPIFLFNWFLSYYLAFPFYWLGASFSDAIKLFYLLSYFASGLTIYLLMKKVTSKTIALISIPFFLLSPYRLNAIFTRNAFGEASAQPFLPLIFLFLLSPNRLSSLAAIFTLTALSLTHNATALITYALLIFWLLLTPRPSNRQKIVTVIIFALALSAFFWLPALVEEKYLHFHLNFSLYQNQFPKLTALLNSPWQYGPPQPEQQHLSMSFQIGKIHWLLFILTPLLWLKRKKLNKLQKRIALFAFTAFILSILLQLKISQPIWDHNQLLQHILFPWKLQMVSIFTLSLLAPLILLVLPCPKIILSLSLLLLLLANRHHFYAALGDYASNEYIKNFITGADSFGDLQPRWIDLEEYNDLRLQKQPPPADIIQPNPHLKLLAKKIKPTSIALSLEAKQPTSVTVNHYYFPGWTGTLNNRSLILNQNLKQTKGRINFTLPPGIHQLKLRFQKTPIRQLASLISLAAFIILILSQLNSLKTSTPSPPNQKIKIK